MASAAVANHSAEPKGTYFKTAERNSVQYSIEFTKTHHDWLVKTASRLRCSRSKIIKEMIQAAIDNEQRTSFS